MPLWLACAMNAELFIAFLLITIVLFATPGPIVTLVVATGGAHGVRPALITVAGTTLGNAVLVGAIAAGLSWILTNALPLFDLLRLAGAAYLIWIGFQAWRQAGKTGALPVEPDRVQFMRGFYVAISNPKTIVFFTAFLPQFVDPALPSGQQLLVMVVTSVGVGAVMDAGWAVASGYGRRWFQSASRTRALGRLSGAVLMGGGLWLALTRR